MNRPSRWQSPRAAALLQAIRSRVLVLDSAMGTAIQDLDLKAADFGEARFEGCPEILVLTRPDLIQGIHEKNLQAGCDIIETNTFGGTPMVLNEFELGDRAYEINKAATELARRAADKYSTPDKPRFVAGAIGPTTKAISVTGGITFQDLTEQFYQQARALVDGGADYLLLETCQDTRNIKAGLFAIDRLERELNAKIWVAISGTIEPMGTMLAGQSVEALLASVMHRDLLYLGLNCATGPEFMTDHIRTLAQLSPFPVSCVPNAGLPDEHGCYLETPEMVGQVLERFLERGWVNVLGGCCGTHAGHVAHLVKLASKFKPSERPKHERSWLSGVDFLEITNEMRPVLVGERTNVIGSKKFKDLIVAGKFEEASEVARAQVKAGAQIIDICLANPDRDELSDIKNFLEHAVKKVRAPLMFDSTDPAVFELALEYSQGKAILNSINLEDGEERFEKVCPMARSFGAAVVVGTIDEDPEQGMGVTRARKLEIAERSFKLLTEKYGIPAEDIYFDPLVFPCATGDAQYVGSAVETIEGIRLIKQKFPKCKTAIGLSNVSFGLPAAGREVLNSVFLYHCVQAGLDLAIVNSEKIERYASISEEAKKLADDLLFNRGPDPVAAFTAYFRTHVAKPKIDRSKIPLEERLAGYILEGSKDGLEADLNEALKKSKPLEIINGPLMKGMDEVGRLFNLNKLIVAEVLQSAEAMKAAVSFLETHMDHSGATASRGTVVLATVKGDVHDIGKNLVEIILSNNGFKVINLGIKVLPEVLIDAVRKHQPDIVGLSGLLVKSAQQMVLTAEDFTRATIGTPVLVGGAALTENFTLRKIQEAYTTGTVAYAKDAMSGLELAKRIVDPAKFSELKAMLSQKRKDLESRSAVVQEAAPIQISSSRSADVPLANEIPKAPDFDLHILKNTPIEQIWKWINPLMLYGRHLGIKGKNVRLLEQLGSSPQARRELLQDEPRAVEIYDKVQECMSEWAGTELMRASAVYQFFKCAGEGNLIHIYQGENGSRRTAATLDLPRQRQLNGLCLSDYVEPVGTARIDNLAMFVTTVGSGVRETADDLKARGDYLKSHILQALALESAEAYAEWIHAQIRRMWGFADPPETTMMNRFQAKYRGKRYSFGYPACPKLDDQRILFDLIKPENAGVTLTDGFMMDPEASVSAVVFHHPAAIYYSVGESPGAENRI